MFGLVLISCCVGDVALICVVGIRFAGLDLVYVIYVLLCVSD